MEIYVDFVRLCRENLRISLLIICVEFRLSEDVYLRGIYYMGYGMCLGLIHTDIITLSICVRNLNFFSISLYLYISLFKFLFLFLRFFLSFHWLCSSLTLLHVVIFYSIYLPFSFCLNPSFGGRRPQPHPSNPPLKQQYCN